MVWDLRRALLAKEEFESARLMDFDFRQKIRAMRLLAAEIGTDENALAARAAEAPTDTVLAEAAQMSGREAAEIAALYAQCLTEARRLLVGERGDPTPHRLG